MQRFRWVRTPAALLALLFFLLHLPAVVGGVRDGMTIATVSVLPALFFFTVAADLIVSLTDGDLRPLSPKTSVFLLGALCGFPVGGIVCDRMCTRGALDRRDAARLLPFVNNASPAFLFGAAGQLFGDKRISLLLFVSELAAAAVCCLPLRIKRPPVRHSSAGRATADVFFGAVDRGVQSMLRVTALLCLFSALLAALRGYFRHEAAFAALAALLEIGNGTARCAALFAAAPRAAVTLCAFGCGWSGLCVHMQILAVSKSVKVKYNRFLLGKAAEGALTAIFAFCGCKFMLGY